MIDHKKSLIILINTKLKPLIATEVSKETHNMPEVV